jgi:hypothetical protein
MLATIMSVLFDWNYLLSSIGIGGDFQIESLSECVIDSDFDIPEAAS